MQRVTVANGGFDPGDGKIIYRDRNIGAGISGTDLVAVNRTTHQEEIANAVELAGLTLNPADDSQLWQAMQLAANHALHGVAFFNTVGTQDFTVPANVFSIEVSMWGPGGGGGYGASGGAAGGGCSGEFIRFRETVTPGQVIPIGVPPVAAGATSGMSQGVGGSAVTCLGRSAQGGGGGESAAGGQGNAGGGAVSGTMQPSDVALLGNPGAGGAIQGAVYFAGAGGSAPFGGRGGQGGLGAGASGQVPGGGGGGGANGNNGGAGDAGAVLIAW
jgi:hypothetical protein